MPDWREFGSRLIVAGVLILVLVATIWTVRYRLIPAEHQYSRCIIANKTLPRPDLYCNALEREGGR